MRRREWSRPKKTVRNLLAAALLLLLFWLLIGFPPLTKEMLAADVARRNLLPGAEIIHESESWQGFPMLYLQKEDTFLQVVYDRQASTLFFYGSWEARLSIGSGGVICLPDQKEPGVLLALGDLEDAENAELEVSDSREPSGALHWAVHGERLPDGAFSFNLPARTTKEEQLLDILQKAACPEFYYTYTLRLYDGGGNLLKTVTGPAWGGEEAGETGEK